MVLLYEAIGMTTLIGDFGASARLYVSPFDNLTAIYGMHSH